MEEVKNEIYEQDALEAMIEEKRIVDMEKQGYVYILTNKTQSVFYVGTTSDIKRRLYEHRNHLIDGFTSKYNVTNVVYVEIYDFMFDAIQREKQLKKWSRNKKISLIKIWRIK